MKKTALLLPVLTLVLITAGCTTLAEETPVGTWITENYTNNSGTHFPRLAVVFSADFRGIEKGFLESGSVTERDFIWMQKPDKTYILYYRPATFVIGPNGMTASLSRENSDEYNLTLSRKSGLAYSVIGTWTAGDSAECDIHASHDGILRLTSGDKTETHAIRWKKNSVNTYLITMSVPGSFTLGTDGTMTDDTGSVFHRLRLPAPGA